VDTPKPRRPSCPALICCEHVEVDTAKGRIDIHNLINAILLETVPGDIRFAVHFTLTEGQGEYDLELVLEHQHGERILGIWQGKTSLRTPMVVHEQPVFVNLRFSLVGQCWVKLYANGELIAQRWLSILRREEKPS
jgi:hypothetical protein